MRSVREIPILQHIPVLVRASLNVPVKNGEVANDYRLRRALPTIQFLKERGARVVLISHIGEAGTETLEPVARALGKLVSGVSFSPHTIGAPAREAVRKLPSGNVLVLENLRRHKGETANDKTFARELAMLADAFVEDSFDTCHRVHASIVGVPALLPSYAGLQLEEEVAALTGALSPEPPSLAAIGGAKFSTKEAVLNRLLERYGTLFVGGALANDFLAAQGFSVGRSLVSGADVSHVEELIANPKLVLPVDVVVIPFSAKDAPDAHAHARTCAPSEVKPDEIILDHGPATATLLEKIAKESKTVLWNGPFGIYEQGFVEGTDAFARAAAASGARSVVGGGDTIASIENLGLMGHFSFVSTGGGAMLDFLAGGTLPGIEALG